MDTHSSAASSASPPPPTRKEIFLSHSGQQKGFARDLDSRLSSVGYTVFFDQNADSLPPGQDFPPHIFSAADTCKLALVLISEDFVTSPWPLMELCSFVDRRHVSPHSFTILPLFFRLSPSQLKTEQNVQKWRKEWKELERKRKNDRINAAKCEEAVTKVLPRLNGVERRPEREQGEGSYIDEIIQRISSILPRRNLDIHRYGDGPDKTFVGLERLCQIILHKFGELEDPRYSSSQSEASFTGRCMLGMFGVPGSGKSTLCHYLCNSMVDEFAGKVIHLELPTESIRDDDPRIKELYVKLFSTLRPDIKDEFPTMDLSQHYNLLLQKGDRFSHKMFLVLDNISPPNYASYERIVKAILRSGILGCGSRVMLTAQSSGILQRLLDYKEHRYTIIEVPCLTKDEAIQVIRHNCYPSVEEHVIPRLLDKCSFPSSSFMYLPFVLEQIGIALKNNCLSHLKELQSDRLWSIVDEGKHDAIQKLVDINFKHLPEKLRDLFFDIVLFIIPAGLSELDKANPVLCGMHDLNDFDLESKIRKLKEHCALSVIGNELRVHDIYVEYSRRIPGNSMSYVDNPSFNLSSDTQNWMSSLSSIRLHTQLDYSDARTIFIDCLTGLPHGHCDEGLCLNREEGASYRHLALEIHLHVKVGSRTRALLVRNSCRYCKCILDPSGDFSSVVCLQMTNLLQSVPFFSTSHRSDSHVSSLVTVEIRNENLENIPLEAWRWQKNRWMSSFVDFIRRSMPSMRSIWLWKSEPSFPWEQHYTIWNQLVSKRSGFTQQISMKCLRTLILCNAGIRRLEIAGTSFPMLEVLEVHSIVKEPTDIDVSIDNPPKLKKLVITASFPTINFNYKPHSYITISGRDWSWQARKLTLHLGNCLQLRDVGVDECFDEVNVGSGLFPSSLMYLNLANGKRLPFTLTKLISSSMDQDQLSLLKEQHLSSKVVKRLDFTRLCSGGLPCLRRMRRQNCYNLTYVSLAPSCMPSLFYWMTLRVFNKC